MPTPTVSNDFYAVNTNPGSFTCDSTGGTEDGFGFKFIAKSNAPVAGVLLYWGVSSGSPRFTVGFEAINTSGVVANPATYVGSVSVANVVPPGSAGSAYVDLSSISPGLVAGTAYALTFRQTGAGTAAIGRLTVPVGLPSNGAPGLITQTNGTWSASASRPGCFIVYGTADSVSGATEQPFGFPILAASTTAFHSGSATDEYGLKWSQGGKATLCAVEWYGQIASLSTTTYELVLYKDDVEVMTQAVGTGSARSAGSTSRMRIPLTASVALTGGSTYRLTIRPNQATSNVTIETQQVLAGAGSITAAAMREAVFGKAHLCSRVNGGSWTDSTDSFMSMTPIVAESVMDGFGSAGGWW